MSLSLEILPTRQIDTNWIELIVNFLNAKFKSNFHVEKHHQNSDHFDIYDDDDNCFIHLRFAIKEESIFPSESYIEGAQNMSNINLTNFLSEFKNMDHSIILESKSPLSFLEPEILVQLGELISKSTNGILIVDTNINGYAVDCLYAFDS